MVSQTASPAPSISPAGSLNQLLAAQRSAFSQNPYPSLSERRDHLAGLERAVFARQDELASAPRLVAIAAAVRVFPGHAAVPLVQGHGARNQEPVSALARQLPIIS